MMSTYFKRMQRLGRLSAVALALAAFWTTPVAAQPGANDPTFNPGDAGFGLGDGPNNRVTRIVLQPDGRSLMVGPTGYNAVASQGVTRVNTDGTLDPSWAVSSSSGFGVGALALQPDGKVVIGGSFTSYHGAPVGRVARLLPDGTLDPSFDAGTGPLGGGAVVQNVAIQNDGKILCVGGFTSFNGTPRNRIVRLDTDGSVDLTFDPGAGTLSDILDVLVQPDGKILIAGLFGSYNGVPRNRIARLNADGSIDMAFDPGTGASAVVGRMELQPDGKIIIAGNFTSYNAVPRARIARLHPDGTLDLSFDPGSGADAQVNATKVLPSGKILVGGAFTLFNGSPQPRMVRLNADGSMDAGFDVQAGPFGPVSVFAVQGDGRILSGGDYEGFNGEGWSYLVRLEPDGNIDPTYNPRYGSNSTVNAIVRTPDGRLLVGGSFSSVNGTLRRRVARLNANGSVDATFDPGGGPNNLVEALAVEPDGKVLVGGSFTTVNGTPRVRVARLNADGSLDATFTPIAGANATVKAIARQPDGKILVAGWFQLFDASPHGGIVRLNSDGSVDGSFAAGSGADGQVEALRLLADGRIIIAGSFSNFNGVPRARIARLNSDGSLDLSFDPGDGANNTVRDIDVLADGRVLAVGSFTEYAGFPRVRMARINANGTLDPTFDPGTGADFAVYRVLLAADGRAYIGGFLSAYNGSPSSGFARVNADGTYDATFNVGAGVNGAVLGMILQPDEKLVIGGLFTAYNGVGRNRLARVIGADPAADISTAAVSGPICSGAVFTVPYTATGIYNPGNTFTAQLSNASGSFASPTNIGSLVATASGTINATMPLATPAGSGYRIRVVSSNPAVVGTDNGADLVVIAATAYYQDNDGDTFGNPDIVSYSCNGAPVGYVANDQDCDDTNASVTVVGSACDADPGPGFVAGTLNSSCVCVPVAGSTENVTLEFNTGGNPADLYWEFQDLSTFAIAESGTGVTYPANSLYQVVVSLQSDRCYKLRVNDSGDGADGYQLRYTATQQRIIDNTDNLGTGLSAISGNGESFCLPMGTNELIYVSCDKYWWRTGEYVVADPDPDVSAEFGISNTTSGYEFWIYNPNGGYNFRRFRNHATSDGFGPNNAVRACHMKLNNWPAVNHVPEFNLHNIRVRARVNGVNKPWGPACRLVRDEALALCAPTKLMDIPGNAFLSCNQFRQFVGNQRIHARPINGATHYQWRFRIEAEAVEILRTTTTYFLNLGWSASVADPLLASKTYTVEVRASRDGGLTWCGTDEPWGDVCLLTIGIQPAQEYDQNFVSITDAPAFSVWPNPNTGDQVHLALTGASEGGSTMDLLLHDAFGRQVYATVATVQDGQLYHTLDLSGFAAGVYVLSVNSGNERHTARLVIQY